LSQDITKTRGPLCKKDKDKNLIWINHMAENVKLMGLILSLIKTQGLWYKYGY
jgi:hypothetical protein